ncbi:hypothetical protein GWK47_014378 [Chionoecetes opilio]|uniref:Uncharacterized protein n=1 Tax=Chionoecetes opilio TaxID=41210 RepID=A0A8J4Y3S5_CHIOP|nr:hypothetical protein GWK47_014378 [Chionoecetes opilio]
MPASPKTLWRAAQSDCRAGPPTGLEPMDCRLIRSKWTSDFSFPFFLVPFTCLIHPFDDLPPFHPSISFSLWLPLSQEQVPSIRLLSVNNVKDKENTMMKVPGDEDAGCWMLEGRCCRLYPLSTLYLPFLDERVGKGVNTYLTGGSQGYQERSAFLQYLQHNTEMRGDPEEWCCLASISGHVTTNTRIAGHFTVLRPPCPETPTWAWRNHREEPHRPHLKVTASHYLGGRRAAIDSWSNDRRREDAGSVTGPAHLNTWLLHLDYLDILDSLTNIQDRSLQKHIKTPIDCFYAWIFVSVTSIHSPLPPLRVSGNNSPQWHALHQYLHPTKETSPPRTGSITSMSPFSLEIAITAVVLPNIQQGKTMARRAAANSTEQQHREMEASSRQAAWYAKATAYRPLLPTRQLSRADEVNLHRLRLGYRTLEELRDDFESRQCDHCGHLARHPLRHYLLSCPATAQLRQQIGGPEDDEGRAALVLRRALEDLPRLLVVVRSAPPPR